MKIASLHNERLKRAAIANGCSPVWSDYYGAWCCGCDDGKHFGDSQCSMITTESANRKRR